MKSVKSPAPSSTRSDASSRSSLSAAKKAGAAELKAARLLVKDLSAKVNETGWKPYKKFD